MLTRSLLPSVRRGLEEATGSGVTAVAPVGGGCISPAFRVTLQDGAVHFLKLRPAGAPAGMLQAEAHSLRAIAASGVIPVPRIIGEAGDGGWLALEWLEPVAPGTSTWTDFGRRLANLHRHARPPESEQPPEPGHAPDAAHPAEPGQRPVHRQDVLHRWGWDHDNWIGTLPQANQTADEWWVFWAERRLRPQLQMATSWFGDDDIADFHCLFDLLEELLAPAELDGPSLLHGDLWNGNVHVCRQGAALIDPSSSYGHREVDLAMAALFGGFPQEFADAYAQAWPLLPGARRRQAVYQLYYLLVHVNLFGAGYVPRTLSVLRQALS